jgi:hypothetical protein
MQQPYQYNTLASTALPRNVQEQNAMGYKTEKDIYNYEKLLLEQDAHLLEEQRYLNRLKNSELRTNKNLDHHYLSITKPSLEKKRQQDQ